MDVQETKFRFGAMRALLTYKGHIPKDGYIDWLTNKINVNIRFIRLAHETGDEETPYNHTHVVFELDKRFQTTNARFFDLEVEGEESGSIINIHPHIKTLPNKKALEDAKAYIAKEDPENADLKKQCIVTKIINCPTAIDALKGNLEKVSDATGILAIYDLRDTDFRTNVPDWSNFEFRPWQTKFLEIALQQPDGRSVYWIYDLKGRSGKSTFADYLEDEYPEKVWVADDLGNSREAATIVQGKLASGWRGNTIWIDLTRCSEDHTRMYDYLERLANGRITSQKYRGRTMRFDKPNLIVSANFVPQIGKMSTDRWRVFNMNNEYDIEPMSLDEINVLLTKHHLGDNEPVFNKLC